VPHIEQGGRNRPSPIKLLKFPWNSPSAPTSPLLVTPTSPARSLSHRRTLSANILAKFNLLKDASDSGDPSGSEDPAEKEESIDSASTGAEEAIDEERSMSSSLVDVNTEPVIDQPVKTSRFRKRKESLRKTAILGGRKLGSENREKKTVSLQRSVTVPLTTTTLPSVSADVRRIPRNTAQDSGLTTTHAPEVASLNRIRRQFSYESKEAMSSSDSGWSIPIPPASDGIQHVGDQRPQNQSHSYNTLGSPVELRSPPGHASYTSASTTDDDDVLTFHRPSKSFIDSSREAPLLTKPLSSAATSYFPIVPSASEVSLTRRRSSKKPRSSPLSRNVSASPNMLEPEPHDYTETEYWGWVILFVTWLTFAVGMGSCLEIWSWAWDVGETPYAPPELEDDPTLPIVGYYPALIVLTGVVAWIWITVAWVGMKYFRHAKIEV
jgi:hypothetical protein